MSDNHFVLMGINVNSSIIDAAFRRIVSNTTDMAFPPSRAIIQDAAIRDSVKRTIRQNSSSLLTEELAACMRNAIVQHVGMSPEFTTGFHAGLVQANRVIDQMSDPVLSLAGSSPSDIIDVVEPYINGTHDFLYMNFLCTEDAIKWAFSPLNMRVDDNAARQIVESFSHGPHYFSDIPTSTDDLIKRYYDSPDGLLDQIGYFTQRSLAENGLIYDPVDQRLIQEQDHDCRYLSSSPSSIRSLTATSRSLDLDAATSIRIAEGITKIDDGALASLPNLTTVYLPKSLLTIGSRAFADCPRLSNVYMANRSVDMFSDSFENTPMYDEFTISRSSSLLPLKFTWIYSGTDDGLDSEMFDMGHVTLRETFSYKISDDGRTLYLRSDDGGAGYSPVEALVEKEPYTIYPWTDNEDLTKVVIEDEIAPMSANGLFCGLPSVTKIENLENLNLDNQPNLSYMFAGDLSLGGPLNIVDLGGLAASNVQTMSSMFEGCTNLKGVIDGGQVTTAPLANMSGMFADCSSLVSLDLSGWDTGKTAVTDQMFDCTDIHRAKISVLASPILTELREEFPSAEITQEHGLPRRAATAPQTDPRDPSPTLEQAIAPYHIHALAPEPATQDQPTRRFAER